MHEQLAGFTAAEGVVFIGRAQEKTPLFRTEKRRDREGKSYPWIVKTTGMVNQFYFYCVDSEFGPGPRATPGRFRTRVITSGTKLGCSRPRSRSSTT